MFLDYVEQFRRQEGSQSREEWSVTFTVIPKIVKLGSGEFAPSKLHLTSAPYSRIMLSVCGKTLFLVFPVKMIQQSPKQIVSIIFYSASIEPLEISQQMWVPNIRCLSSIVESWGQWMQYAHIDPEMPWRVMICAWSSACQVSASASSLQFPLNCFWYFCIFRITIGLGRLSNGVVNTMFH